MEKEEKKPTEAFGFGDRYVQKYVDAFLQGQLFGMSELLWEKIKCIQSYDDLGDDVKIMLLADQLDHILLANKQICAMSEDLDVLVHSIGITEEDLINMTFTMLREGIHMLCRVLRDVKDKSEQEVTDETE